MVGLRRTYSNARRLVVFQAFVDESGDADRFVLAGYISPTAKWVQFAAEWEHLLPYGILGPNGYHFKMCEMAKYPERMERVPAFYRLIEKYVDEGFAISLRMNDWKNACARLKIVDRESGREMSVEGGPFNSEYYVGFLNLIEFVSDRVCGAKVDLILDERSEKEKILSSWEFWSTHPRIRESFGSHPRFERDDEFLPLQAADLLAWWMRRWLNEPISLPKIGDFPWAVHRQVPIHSVHLSEATIFEQLAESLIRGFPELVVMDRNEH